MKSPACRPPTAVNRVRADRFGAGSTQAEGEHGRCVGSAADRKRTVQDDDRPNFILHYRTCRALTVLTSPKYRQRTSAATKSEYNSV
jgi:hypothetical protein